MCQYHSTRPQPIQIKPFGTTYLDPKSKNNCTLFSSIFQNLAPFPRYGRLKSKFLCERYSHCIYSSCSIELTKTRNTWRKQQCCQAMYYPSSDEKSNGRNKWSYFVRRALRLRLVKTGRLSCRCLTRRVVNFLYMLHYISLPMINTGWAYILKARILTPTIPQKN